MSSKKYLGKNKLKVCYILSYKSTDYIRTGVLVGALKRIPWIELSEARNSTKSVLRYPQTFFRVLKTRITKRPQVYILGFRGHEMYWPVRILTFSKPLIFDEFINSDDWLSKENNKIYIMPWMVGVVKRISKSILKSAALVLSDTKLDAISSAHSHNIKLSKYEVIYVGADESLFYPEETKKESKVLEVFFYGTMAPLHGLKYILKTAKELINEPVHFIIVGGKGKPKMINYVKSFISKNKLSNVTYKEWLSYEEIPKYMRHAHLTLGGPFGGTSQSRRVITGKTYQSLAVGVPVVVGEINENVGLTDKVNCLLVDQASTTSLVKAISWAIDNKAQLNKIGRNGRFLYEKKFSVSRVSKQLELILTGLNI